MSIVVVGDALLDVDLVGRAGRLMPEAAAPVLDELEEQGRPGGAALAASLLPDAVLVTAWVPDADGERLRAELGAVPLVALPHDGATPVKRRVLAGDHAVARLDSGGIGRVGTLPPSLRALLAEADAVLVSDYGQGTVAAVLPLLASLPRSVPVVWDPHPRGPRPVAGVRLATPNQAEALQFAGMSGRGLNVASKAARALADQWSARAVAVTLGAKGALLSQSGAPPTIVPSPPVVARDTCGAGDRFAGAAAQALAAGALTSEAVEQAVRAASEFVSMGGAAGVGAPRSGTLVATGGCFDLLHAGHVATLEAARSLGDRLVVCLNSDASVRRLKGPERPLVPEADRARVLRALACVDEVVVFSEDTPSRVIAELRPDVWVKGGDYAGADLPEAELLSSWGGQAVVVPYLRGRSTTQLVETARATS